MSISRTLWPLRKEKEKKDLLSMEYIARAKLRSLRLEKGYSQEDLARLADVKLNTISRLEALAGHDPKLSTVVQVALALGVKLHEIINPEIA